MHNTRKHFFKKLHTFIERANKIRTIQKNNWGKIYLTETLISETWQLWNLTCRDILIHSCQGSMGCSGISYSPRLSDNSHSRIAYEVKQSGASRAITANGKITNHWELPTWGDGNKIIRVIENLNTNNKQQLLTSFGLPFTGHMNLQKLRNYLFHKDHATFQAIAAIFRSSLLLRIHPALIAWEYANMSNTFYFFDWLNDMRTIIFHATE